MLWWNSKVRPDNCCRLRWLDVTLYQTSRSSQRSGGLPLIFNLVTYTCSLKFYLNASRHVRRSPTSKYQTRECHIQCSGSERNLVLINILPRKSRTQPNLYMPMRAWNAQQNVPFSNGSDNYKSTWILRNTFTNPCGPELAMEHQCIFSEIFACLWIQISRSRFPHR